MTNITHVLFDLDGLLLDTEKFYTDVQRKIVAGYGKTLTWAIKSKMLGKRPPEAAATLIKECGLEGVLSPESLLTQRNAMLELLFPSSELLPGAEKLIEHFHTHRIPMAIATSSVNKHFGLKTINHKKLISRMSHVVMGDDPNVKFGKPAPDIFLVAASRFSGPKPRPENILVFEDAPTGVTAARQAGMHVVMVPDSRLDRSLCKQADVVLSTLDDFEPSVFGLSLFNEEFLRFSQPSEQLTTPSTGWQPRIEGDMHNPSAGLTGPPHELLIS